MKSGNIAELVLDCPKGYLFSPKYDNIEEFAKKYGNERIPKIHLYDLKSFPAYQKRFSQEREENPFMFPEPIVTKELPDGDIFWIFRDIQKLAKKAGLRMQMGAGYGGLGGGGHGRIGFDRKYLEDEKLELLKQFVLTLYVENGSANRN